MFLCVRVCMCDAQVLVQWNFQQGVPVVVKASSAAHAAEVLAPLPPLPPEQARTRAHPNKLTT
eukprot:5629224-Pleurochrysis_carterae.AAC.3